MSPSFEAGAREAMLKTAGFTSSAMSAGRRVYTAARPWAPEILGALGGSTIGLAMSSPDTRKEWVLGGALGGALLGRMKFKKFHSGQMLP